MRLLWLTKWALVQQGPLTVSGLSEVIMTARYKKDLVAYAKNTGLRISGRRATHRIIPLWVEHSVGE